MSVSDLPTIGAHCSLERCNVNDFLPIKCRCERVFCKDHISPDSHLCPLVDASLSAVPTAPAEKLQRCAAKECNKPSLEAFMANKSGIEGRTPALCPQCRKAFCARYALLPCARCISRRTCNIFAVIVNPPRMRVLLNLSNNRSKMRLAVHSLQRCSPLRPRPLSQHLHPPFLRSVRLLRKIQRKQPSCDRSSS